MGFGSRIHHCHCKNAVSDGKGGYEWFPVDRGVLDGPAQFRALTNIGYTGAVSLETHWRGAGPPKASTRIDWDGMKRCLEHAAIHVPSAPPLTSQSNNHGLHS